MHRRLTVVTACVLATLTFVALAEDALRAPGDEGVVLESVLKTYPKFLYTYALVTDAGTQECALVEPAGRTGQLLPKVTAGSRVRVSGRLGTRLHPGGTPAHPSPFGRTWVIYMEVVAIEAVAKPDAAGGGGGDRATSGPASAPSSRPSATIDEARAIEAARRAVAANDTWAERATYTARHDGRKWSVIAWRIEGHDAAGNPQYVPGGHRVIVLDEQGNVSAYLRGS